MVAAKKLSRGIRWRGVLETLAAIFGLIGCLFSDPAFALEKKPNIIFILSDDHRWDAMGNMGHPFLQTPSLDRLAQEGIRFNNAFVTTLCSPSGPAFSPGCIRTGTG
jgi:N-acetylglucosamine-6-sulfatase